MSYRSPQILLAAIALLLPARAAAGPLEELVKKADLILRGTKTSAGVFDMKINPVGVVLGPYPHSTLPGPVLKGRTSIQEKVHQRLQKMVGISCSFD